MALRHVVTAILIIISIFIMRHLRTSLIPRAAKKADDLDRNSTEEPSRLSKSLASALPDSVVFPHDAANFKKSINSYWAQQECEVIPACFVRPHDTQQLSTAISILNQEYNERRKAAGENKNISVFAVRSGGHSPIAGAASISGGVVVDLSLFCEVRPSADGSYTVIGTGAKWMDVSKVLDDKSLAVVGGRNSAVGVGGLTLGGGLSFFSPRFGLVCSNILSYEVVLASGSIITASASSNIDLWRALKGGSNNFGIVTRFTVRSFPSTNIWSGFLYMPAFQAQKVLAAFREFVDNKTTYDEYAAGPLACFSYIQQLGAQAISINLVHTKPPENAKKWPTCWKGSSFGSLWRLWSTCKIRTLTSATDELNTLNPSGRRQVFGTTTIKNDIVTLIAAHAAYYDAITSLRPAKLKGLVWSLILQPLLPSWARRGDPNPLGLHDAADEPLVIVSFAVNWDERRDDDLVETTTRRVVEQIEAFAVANGTAHPYKYLNYCGDWQSPFDGYGKQNLQFLQDVSKRYDPKGLFQRGCTGGFKLGMKDLEV